MPNIRHLIAINASAGTVYSAVTTRAGLAAWWTNDVEDKSASGDALRLHFGPGYFKDLQSKQTLANQRAVWKVVDGDPQWLKTELVFDIRHDAKGTRLFFEHNGWKDYTDLFSQCSYDWSVYLRSLKSYCETGMGKPFPDQL
jgi:uncharacterized protein YndB with AHSA1/START domain